MKKTLLVSVIGMSVLVMSQQAMGQAAWYASPGTGSGSLLTNSSTLNVGIGNPSSVDQILTVNGNISLNNTTDGNERSVCGHTTSGRFNVYASTPNNPTTGAATGPFIQMWGQTGSRKGGIDFVDIDAAGTTGCTFYKYNISGNAYTTQMQLDNSGNLSLYTGNLSLSTGNVSLGPGNLSMSSGNITLTSGDLSAGGGIITYPNNIQRTSIGPAWDPGMYGTGYIGFNLWRITSGWNYINDGNANGASLIYGGADGSINFCTKSSTGATNGNLTAAQVVADVKMRLDGATGKLIIGTDLMPTANYPNTYLLYVEKGILTEKLKVANSSDPTNWSDFVFNKGYNLMSLDKVASYIKTNKHLPEIPTASEVAKDGIDVADMDAKLLQKIEELTLYIIQQQKEIDELKEQQRR